MNGANNILQKIDDIKQAILDSGYFEAGDLGFSEALSGEPGRPGAIDKVLDASSKINDELRDLAAFIQERVIDEIIRVERRVKNPEDFLLLRDLLERVLPAAARFNVEHELIPVYGELLSLYISTLHKCSFPGQDSPIIRIIMDNIARRKAIELSQSQHEEAYARIENVITIAIIAKRYAVYVLCTKGFKVLFKSEIEFRTYGTSPESLALQITNILLKNGIRLSDVTNVVCGGGDLGALPDGIYVLTEKVRDESWKRLHNSSLNRGALVAWELRNLLRRQSDQDRINTSLCSPLSFTTLKTQDHISLFREESRELKQSLRGYVKVTPLKSMAALLSEIQQVRPEKLNMVAMTLDELFASAAKKTGPRILREMAAQDANATLINFDFTKIVEHLKQEGFVIPPNFRLASREIGTGVKEICELLMIVNSGKISTNLSKSLMHVVDCYAKQVAMVLEMSSAGAPSERPQFIVITSMMAQDEYFQDLFQKIRNRVDNPFTPIMCLDSMEHEYLIANHLFELYVNPAKDRRLHYTVEARSMKQALQVLGSAGLGTEIFSFSSLLDEVTGYITDGTLTPANLTLVGADNEDALVAVSNAKDYGLINKLALIGDPGEVMTAIERCKVPLSPGIDPKVQLIGIDPLAVDVESKKASTAEVFRGFLGENKDYIIMKGSVDTASLLQQALSIYKSDPVEEGAKPTRKTASHTAIFVLPDGRFFALSDAAVNPGFRSADALLKVIENQVEVVRKVIDTSHVLKVAIITAVEKETSAIPSTLLAGEAEQRSGILEESYGPLIVEGPLSFDLATAPEVAAEKHYEGRIMGDANCLVATDINTANVLYKMLSKTMGSLGVIVDNGSVITAGPGTVPIVLTSRGDTAQTKFNSILLALAYSSPVRIGSDRLKGSEE
jgi:phosphate butyryltransferase